MFDFVMGKRAWQRHVANRYEQIAMLTGVELLLAQSISLPSEQTWLLSDSAIFTLLFPKVCSPVASLLRFVSLVLLYRAWAGTNPQPHYKLDRFGQQSLALNSKYQRGNLKCFQFQQFLCSFCALTFFWLKVERNEVWLWDTARSTSHSGVGKQMLDKAGPGQGNCRDSVFSVLERTQQQGMSNKAAETWL